MDSGQQVEVLVPSLIALRSAIYSVTFIQAKILNMIFHGEKKKKANYNQHCDTFWYRDVTFLCSFSLSAGGLGLLSSFFSWRLLYPLQSRLAGKKAVYFHFKKEARKVLLTKWYIRFIMVFNYLLRPPGGASGKESIYQCSWFKRCKFNLWVGKIPWRRKWQLTAVFLPVESPRTEKPGGLQSMGLQRVGHDWAT